MTSPIRLNRKDLRDLIVSVLLFVLAFPPSPLGFLIYIAFIPQIFIYRRYRPKKAFLFGYLIGLFINMITLHWILIYNGLGYSLIVLGNAFQFAIAAGIISLFDKQNEKYALFTFPFIWTFLEYTRQLGDLGFNWLNIANTQTYYLPLIQYLDQTGYLGVVIWICFVNVSIFLLWSNRNEKFPLISYTAVLLLLFILPLAYGLNKLAEKPTAKGISVAYIQPNIDPDLKWESGFKRENIRILSGLTDSALVTGANLLIWPETGIPYYLEEVKEDRDFIYNHTKKHNYYLLTGAVDKSFKDGRIHQYNATYFFVPGDTTYAVYRKLRLVPVEEGLPYQKVFSKWICSFGEDLLTPGDDAIVFNMSSKKYRLQYSDNDWCIIDQMSNPESTRIASVICYESIFPNLIRRFYKLNFDLLVILTNDAWFGYTAQPFHHMQIAVLRAIEYRCPVVRCANSGVSSFIDPYGRQFFSSQIFTRAIAQKVVPLKKDSTFYAEYGDWPGIISGILVFSFLTLTILARKKQIQL